MRFAVRCVAIAVRRVPIVRTVRMLRRQQRQLVGGWLIETVAFTVCIAIVVMTVVPMIAVTVFIGMMSLRIMSLGIVVLTVMPFGVMMRGAVMRGAVMRGRNGLMVRKPSAQRDERQDARHQDAKSCNVSGSLAALPQSGSA